MSGEPVAIVDIGSNSVRLVSYESHSRAPTPTFNEKALCGLGKGVAMTGILQEDATVVVTGDHVHLVARHGIGSAGADTIVLRSAADGDPWSVVV